ncbi:MAG: fumarylacetoacetate hydrolase family protein [Bacteroidota bacterium]
MKLIRFGPKGQEKPGVLIEGIRKDCSAHFQDWDRSFFQANGLEELQKLLRQAELPVVGQEVRWGAPIARPGTILCVGLNYSDHAKESGLEPPKEPVLFMKSTNTIAGPYDTVQIPHQSEKTDWEVELGIVLKRDALYLASETEAADCIAGYCVVNDLSEREFQLERSGQWVKGKSCPGFSPVGPWLSTADEVEDPSDLPMKLWVNDDLRQDGNTKTMIFSPTYVIWYVSQFMQLEAGDLISTGTPPGVGLGMKPPTYLKPEDEVRLTIGGLGSQRQKFRE